MINARTSYQRPLSLEVIANMWMHFCDLWTLGQKSTPQNIVKRRTSNKNIQWDVQEGSDFPGIVAYNLNGPGHLEPYLVWFQYI